MEIARRLRFLWACLCLINIVASAAFNMWPSAIAAAFGAYAFYAPTWPRRLSILWLGFVGINAIGLTLRTDPTGVAPMAAIIGGVWLVAAISRWLFTGKSIY